MLVLRISSHNRVLQPNASVTITGITDRVYVCDTIGSGCINPQTNIARQYSAAVFYYMEQGQGSVRWTMQAYVEFPECLVWRLADAKSSLRRWSKPEKLTLESGGQGYSLRRYEDV